MFYKLAFHLYFPSKKRMKRIRKFVCIWVHLVGGDVHDDLVAQPKGDVPIQVNKRRHSLLTENKDWIPFMQIFLDYFLFRNFFSFQILYSPPPINKETILIFSVNLPMVIIYKFCKNKCLSFPCVYTIARIPCDDFLEVFLVVGLKFLFYKIVIDKYYCKKPSSVSDPYHFDADPDPLPGWWIRIRVRFWIRIRPKIEQIQFFSS